MSTQFLTNDNGKKTFAVIPFSEYERLLKRLEMADDVQAYDKAMAEGGEIVPEAVVERLLSDVHPVTVWREYRGMTGVQLAEKTKITAAMISQIENGKREGSLKVMKSIAEALDVTLDDVC